MSENLSYQPRWEVDNIVESDDIRSGGWRSTSCSDRRRITNNIRSAISNSSSQAISILIISISKHNIIKVFLDQSAWPEQLWELDGWRRRASTSPAGEGGSSFSTQTAASRASRPKHSRLSSSRVSMKTKFIPFVLLVVKSNLTRGFWLCSVRTSQFTNKFWIHTS